MAAEYALQAKAYYLYDGTNSAEILTAAQVQYPSASIVSEADGVLTLLLDSFFGNTVLATGDHLGINSAEVVSAAAWAEQFIVKA
jgi:hypothetical protein